MSNRRGGRLTCVGSWMKDKREGHGDDQWHTRPHLFRGQWLNLAVQQSLWLVPAGPRRYITTPTTQIAVTAGTS